MKRTSEQIADDLKHYGHREHDRQGLILGVIGVVGLILLCYSFGMDVKP